MCRLKFIGWFVVCLACWQAGADTGTSPGKVVMAYALTSANDFQQRDPLDWRLLASNDGGSNWITLDVRQGELFSDRQQRRLFPIANTNAFNTYRFQIDRVREPKAANSVQLAELELLGKSPDDVEPTPTIFDRVSAQGDNPPLETVRHAFDGLVETKWLDRPSERRTCASWIQWQYVAPVGVTLTNLAQLQALRRRAAAGFPVRMAGVMGGKIAAGQQVELLDDTGVLALAATPELLATRPGQRVVLTGCSAWENQRPAVASARLETAAASAPPAPVRIRLEQPLPAGADFLWVQAEGEVQFVRRLDGQVVFELQDDREHLSVSLAADLAPSMPTAGQRLRVTGICRGGFNQKGVWVAAALRATGLKEVPVTEDEAVGDSSLAWLEPVHSAKAGAPGITKISQIRAQSQAEWRQRPTVTVRGVVTSLIGIYVQDDSAGLQVVLKPGDSRRVPALGEYVEIKGQVGVSDAFTPLITADRVVLLGRGKLPLPQHPPWGQLANGRMDSQWVEMEGVVRATDGAHVLLNCDGRQVTASLGAAAAPMVNQLVDATIKLRGVGLAALDDWGRMQGVHLLVPSLEYLAVEQAPAVPFSQPIQPVATISKMGGQVDAAHRVRVEGVLTLQDGEQLFLQDASGSILTIYKQKVVLDSAFGRAQWSFWRTAATNQSGGGPVKFSPGDRLEVLGFQEAHGYSPVLTEVLVRKTGTGTASVKEITSDSFSDWKLDASLVRLDGVLISQQSIGARVVLEVVAHGRTLRVFLPADIREPVNILPGTRLRLTGVWQMDPVPYVELGRSVGGIRLLTRSPADWEILSRPSWWTVEHALAVIGGLTFVLLAASVWITQLRRQVEQRSAQLTAEIRRREQIERQRALEEERARIARDLHDDLGAALTQIRFLSAVESRDEAVPGETRAQLREVSEKSNQLVTSLDEIVWAINPANDYLPKLVNYLCHVAEEFFRPTPIRCRMEVAEPLPPVALTSEVRHNLYLVVREAMNNIAKHSQATEVWLRIRLEDNHLDIGIEDNGRGFVAAAEAVGEGLQNMRQRVAQIGGQFTHETNPGQGTTCRLRLPLAAAAPPRSGRNKGDFIS